MSMEDTWLGMETHNILLMIYEDLYLVLCCSSRVEKTKTHFLLFARLKKKQKTLRGYNSHYNAYVSVAVLEERLHCLSAGVGW